MPGTEKSCPCGSGKPYEKCCGRGTVFYSLDQVRWRRAGQDLRRSLGQFADKTTLSWDAARAQDIYLGCLDPALVDSDDDFIMERCFEWFIFDYKLTSGRTVIDTFRKEQPAGSDQRQDQLLKDWSSSRISLYEVSSVLPNESIIIKNLLEPGEVTISDVNAAGEIEAGNILLIRILKVGSEYEFSTSGLALPARFKELLLKKLRQDREQYYKEKKNNPRGWASYLKERAHIINAWVLGLGGPEPGAGRVPAGKKGTERRTVLPILNWREVLDVIKQEGCFGLIGEVKDASGIFRQATAAILGKDHHAKEREEAGAARGGKAVLRPVIGNLILTPRFVIVSAGSPDLLSECRDILNYFFKGSIIGETNRNAPVNSLREVSEYNWASPGHAAVAAAVQDGMQALGYSLKQQEQAVKLWFDYCSAGRPVIRKPSLWAAAVIYALSWVKSERDLKQRELAGRYGLPPSALSYRFRLLRRALNLVARDSRYVTEKSE
ncbi:SEC-C domain-containing protein [Pelotomaculum propionicicum]|uniref:HTH psq-type domain-containing protein n=1 Tax=Pelotomaculum propionicicum TaxID=258475 RepID=A0A4Y7RLJ9_9FIRM|nr:SEC-C domain-containing protein [Pelotomaculum propionicicum]TEB09552.1 hypothetical protein Pmgp_03047 [Pelotomaculum propionicicum]